MPPIESGEIIPSTPETPEKVSDEVVKRIKSLVHWLFSDLKIKEETGLVRRDFLVLLAGLGAGTVLGSLLPRPQKKPIDRPSPIPWSLDDNGLNNCETILDDSLKDLVFSLKKICRRQFNKTPEEIVTLKEEATGTIGKIKTAFRLLEPYRLQHRINPDILSDEYFAAEIKDGPETGRIIVVHRYLSRKTSRPDQKVPYTTTIEGDLHKDYFVLVSDTEIGKGVNRDHIITVAPRSKSDISYTAKLLASKKPINLFGKEKEAIYSPPHNEEFNNPLLVLKGYKYLEPIVAEAQRKIKYGKNFSHWSDFIAQVGKDFVIKIVMTENLDPFLLVKGAEAEAFLKAMNKTLLTLNGNEGNSFTACKSPGYSALGLAQVIPSSYENLQTKYDKDNPSDKEQKLLTGDFVEDLLNHRVAAIICFLHLYDEYLQIIARPAIKNDKKNKNLIVKNPEGQEICYDLKEILGAGYNQRLDKVINILEKNLNYPDLLRNETRPYVEKLVIITAFLEILQEYTGLVTKEDMNNWTINPPPIADVLEPPKPVVTKVEKKEIKKVKPGSVKDTVKKIGQKIKAKITEKLKPKAKPSSKISPKQKPKPLSKPPVSKKSPKKLKR